jgi:DNA-3-methyladenine glycosylase I
MSERSVTMGDDGLIVDVAGQARCWWCAGDPLYLAYHDREWGRPVVDDRRLFEKLCLEGFQSGLSWLTILRKREHFRSAFAGFDFTEIARWGEAEVGRLIADAGIVRHRGKIESTLNNARRASDMAAAHGSLAAYFWRFEPPPSRRPAQLDRPTLLGLGKTAESSALSRELKRLGWSFVGPTTVYAFMQAVGLVNDHLEGCHARAAIEAERSTFTRPG